MANFGDLPEEVVREILKRLPPESLIRFKCVRRSWYSLITDPAFVSKHLHHHHKNNNTCSPSLFVRSLSIHTWLKLEEFKIFNLLDDNDDDDWVHSVVEYIDSPIVPGGEEDKMQPLSHCDGIILLANLQKNTILLWNPAIREFNLLQNSFSADGFLTVGVGFGYDCRAKDYKVVRIIVSCMSPLRAEVFTLGSDTWREINMDVEFDHTYVRGQVYNNGVFYWWTRNDKKMVLSFDMCDEEFHVIPVPDDVNGEEVGWVKLAVWNGSIALFFSSGNGVRKFIEMWVMDDCFGGVKGCFSWTKHLMVETPPDIRTAVAFWNNDELLMEKTYWKISGGKCKYTQKLVFFNLHTKRVRDLPFNGVIPGNSIAFSYLKSLISVKGRNYAKVIS